MSDAVTLTKQAIVSAGSAPVAPVIVLTASLVDLDWLSLLIAINVAGVVGLVSASSRFDRERREGVTWSNWLTEYGVAMTAGLVAWGFVSLGGFDPRVQLAAIALSGWSGRPFLDGSMWIWDRVRLGK